MKFSLGLHLVLAGGLEAGGLLGVYKARATDFGAGDVLTCPCWGSRGWGSRGWGSTRLGQRILELGTHLPVLAGGLEAGGLEAQSKT